MNIVGFLLILIRTDAVPILVDCLSMIKERKMITKILSLLTIYIFLPVSIPASVTNILEQFHR